MALGTPTAAAAAYSAASGTSVAPAYPTGIAAEDVLVLIVGQKPTTANGGTVTTPTGWTLQESLTAAGGYGTTIGADTGNTNLRIYTKDTVTGSETGTLSVTLGDNNVSWAFIVRVPVGNGTVSYGTADGQRTTTPTSPMSIALTNGTSATNFQAGDVAIWAMCIPTDVSTPSQFSAESITATGATFGTAVEFNEPDSTTGNDIGGYSAYATCTAGSSTTAPTVTTTLTGTLTNVRGPVVLLRIRETAPPSQGVTTTRFTNTSSVTAPTVTADNPLAASRYSNTSTFGAAVVTAGAVNLTATRYSNTSTFLTPVISQSGGAQSLAPTRYVNSSTLYSSVVAAKSTLTAARFSNTNSFSAASVKQTLQPARFSNTNTFYTPAATSRIGVTAQRYTNVSVIYPPTAGLGGILLAPARYSNPNQFPAASLSAVRSLSASRFSNSSAVYPPTVASLGFAQDLTASLYTNANSLPAPTISASITLTFSSYADSGYAADGYIGGPTQNADALYPPTVTATYALSANKLTNTSTFRTLTVRNVWTVSAQRFANTSTLYPPAVSLADYVLAAQRFSNASQFRSPKIRTTVYPQTTGSSNQFYSASLRYTVKPQRIQTANQFYAVTVVNYSQPKTLYASLYESQSQVRPALAKARNALEAQRLDNQQAFLGGDLSVGPVIPPPMSVSTDVEYSKLRSETEYSVLSSSMAYAVLAAAIAYVTIRAKAAYSKLSASISYAALRAAAEIGEFLRFLRFSEDAEVSDSYELSVTKGKSELLSASDTRAITVSRSISESLAASETVTRTIGKGVAELLTSTDITSRVMTKSVNDSTYATDDINGASADDDQVVQFLKARSDLANTSDIIAIVSSFIRAYSDTAATTDVANKTIDKSRSDTAVTADSGFVKSQGYCDIEYFAEDYVGATRTF